jgi:hypothetical protein
MVRQRSREKSRSRVTIESPARQRKSNDPASRMHGFPRAGDFLGCELDDLD